jgi:hypothetical protein
MVTEFGDQNMREQPRTRHAAIDWPAGRSRLHNAVATGTGLLESAVTNHSPMPRHVVELLGDVLAELAKRTAALRTARVVGLMNNVFARQMFRKWLASRRLAGFWAGPCRCVDRRRTIVGLQIFETQFQLFDLAINLLRLAPELHALEFRDPQLQVLDLDRPVGECLPERRYSSNRTRRRLRSISTRRLALNVHRVSSRFRSAGVADERVAVPAQARGPVEGGGLVGGGHEIGSVPVRAVCDAWGRAVASGKGGEGNKREQFHVEGGRRFMKRSKRTRQRFAAWQGENSGRVLKNASPACGGRGLFGRFSKSKRQGAQPSATKVFRSRNSQGRFS